METLILTTTAQQLTKDAMNSRLSLAGGNIIIHPGHWPPFKRGIQQLTTELTLPNKEGQGRCFF